MSVSPVRELGPTSTAIATEDGGGEADEWGHSLANLHEVLVAVLDVAGARTIAEVGAWAGDLTRDLADWAESRGGDVIAIDPFPRPALVELADERDSVQLVREPSRAALASMPRTDAVVIDGDHNYHTVSSELSALSERFGGEQMPLLLLHDVGWPHARRDNYFDPEAIPSEARHEFATGGALPGNAELAPAGLLCINSAVREGGPGNGVLTALEDFLAGREDLRAAIVPAFFGLGVVWPTSAGWAEELARLLAPFDRNPLLERLEAHRVLNVARLFAETHQQLAEIDRLREANRRKDEWLQRLAGSRAFRFAETLARLRGGARWSQQVRALISDG